MKANHMKYKPKTVYPVLPVLLQEFFPWVTTALNHFELDSQNNMCFANEHKTAQVLLAMIGELQSVFIQDAAAMLLECPDCAHHGLFQHPVFSITGGFQ